MELAPTLSGDTDAEPPHPYRWAMLGGVWLQPDSAQHGPAIGMRRFGVGVSGEGWGEFHGQGLGDLLAAGNG